MPSVRSRQHSHGDRKQDVLHGGDRDLCGDKRVHDYLTVNE